MLSVLLSFLVIVVCTTQPAMSQSFRLSRLKNVRVGGGTRFSLKFSDQLFSFFCVFLSSVLLSALIPAVVYSFSGGCIKYRNTFSSKNFQIQGKQLYPGCLNAHSNESKTIPGRCWICYALGHHFKHGRQTKALSNLIQFSTDFEPEGTGENAKGGHK